MSHKSVFSQPLWMSALAATGVIAGCATPSPQTYNPDHLAIEQEAKVEQVCQTVMRLNPGDLQVQNYWPGDPDPATYTNDYRGCVSALSTSMLSGAPTQNEQKVPAIVEREEQACAAIGIEPARPQFNSCVNDLHNVVLARQLNKDYRN
jgi:hypothetical protein